MRARCRSSGEDYNLVMLNVKESFDVELLESFCSLRLRKDLADVTEGQLIAEIKALLAKAKNDDMSDIKAVFDKELVMDLAETDVDARILAYFQKFKQVVLEHGLEDVFSGDDGENEKCRRLVSCLAPPVLKADVKTAVRWTDKAALYGFLKITNTQDLQAKNDPNEPNLVDLFKEGEPDEDKPTSVLGRRSYIDDILVTAATWENLCEKVDKLLDACDEWNLSISVVKSFWGMKKVDYLGHSVSADGMEARPKDLSSLANLPFTTTLRSMQPFLGSLNYYSRFIEDFAIYASILYELREADFFEATRRSKINPEVGLTGVDDSQPGCEDKWARAMTASTVLKDKPVRAPILRLFDPDRRPVVVVYASKWAISAALMQDHDGVYQPVTFISRTLKPNEINYGVVDKEVLALLRVLDVCYTQLVTRSIKVLTRHSTLAWLVNSSGLQGRLGRWAALLSGWILEIVKCAKGEDEILGVMAASITPREEVDAILTSIAPRKQPRQAITMLPPTVELDEKLLVVSFDGSARVKRSGGAFSAVVWSLPEWSVISAASKYKTDLTVNEPSTTECYSVLISCPI